MAKSKLMADLDAALRKVAKESDALTDAIKDPAKLNARTIANAGRNLNNTADDLQAAIAAAQAHIDSYNKESLFKSARNVFMPKLKTARDEFKRVNELSKKVNSDARDMVKAAEVILGQHV